MQTKINKWIKGWGFPGGSVVKNPAANAGDHGSIPELGRSPGGRHGNPLQYCCLENPHGQRSLAGYNPWGLKELDTTEQLNTSLLFLIRKVVSDCDPMPGFPVLHYLQEFAQTHVHWVSDAIRSSHLRLPPSPPALKARILKWFAIPFSRGTAGSYGNSTCNF